MPSVQGRAHKGSQKWLQMAVNECPRLLNGAILCGLPDSPTDIDWRSPLAKDNYKEHRDKEFLDELGVSRFLRKPLPSWNDLYSFWPKSGPRWDAHGITDKGQIVLVEAKSHITELQGQGSGATNQKSVEKIARSLHETQQFLGADPSIDWAKSPYFQFANRLAFLYWFHELNGRDAYLVLLYFLNDKEMNSADTYVPSTPGEWISVVTHQDRLMGIRQRHPLSDRIIHAYIDVNDIEAYQ